MDYISTTMQAVGFGAAMIGLYLLLPIGLFLVVGGTALLVLGVLTEIIAHRAQEPAPNKPVLLRKKGGE